MVIDPCANYGMPISKLTEVIQVRHEDMPKAYKLDLEVKGQHRIQNMNVCVVSSHGDRPMCQIY